MSLSICVFFLLYTLFSNKYYSFCNSVTAETNKILAKWDIVKRIIQQVSTCIAISHRYLSHLQTSAFPRKQKINLTLDLLIETKNAPKMCPYVNSDWLFLQMLIPGIICFVTLIMLFEVQLRVEKRIINSEVKKW